MRKISSKGSRPYKLMFPTLLYGGCVYACYKTVLEHETELIIFILLVVFVFSLMTGILWIMKKLYNMDYVDEAYDQGTQFYFKNGRKTATVPFSQVEELELGRSVKSPIIILHLKTDTDLGDKITVMIRNDYIYLDDDNRLDDLIDRVEKAKA